MLTVEQRETINQERRRHQQLNCDNLPQAVASLMSNVDESVHMINSIYCASLYSLCCTVYKLLHLRLAPRCYQHLSSMLAFLFPIVLRIVCEEHTAYVLVLLLLCVLVW